MPPGRHFVRVPVCKLPAGSVRNVTASVVSAEVDHGEYRYRVRRETGDVEGSELSSFVWACCVVVVAVFGVGAFYVLLGPGLSSARTDAPAGEVTIATGLDRYSCNAFADD